MSWKFKHVYNVFSDDISVFVCYLTLQVAKSPAHQPSQLTPLSPKYTYQYIKDRRVGTVNGLIRGKKMIYKFSQFVTWNTQRYMCIAISWFGMQWKPFMTDLLPVTLKIFHRAKGAG